MDQWFAEKLAGAQAAYLEQALVGVLREAFLASRTETKGQEIIEAAEGGLDAVECARLRSKLRPIRDALAKGQGRRATPGGEVVSREQAADAAVLAGHSFLTEQDLAVLRWKRQRAWQKRKQNRNANLESTRLTELRETADQVEALLQSPPLHSHTLLVVKPKLGKAVLATLFDANRATIPEIKRGMALLDVIGGREFNQRLWSRMMNPVHSGAQHQLVSHHNQDSYF